MKNVSRTAPLGASALAVASVARPRGPALILPHTVAPRAVQSFNPRADVNDPAKVLADLQKAWNDFQATNDERIASKADVIVDAKVKAINDEVGKLQAGIDEMTKKLAAAQLNGAGGDGRNTPERQAYSEAFGVFFRSGAGGDALKALAIKAQLTRQSDPDGGYVVSPEIEKEIDRVLGMTSAMRGLATVRTTGASTYKKRVGLGGATSGWVGENEARAETGTPRISELEFPAMTLYAEPEATEEMLEDADFDIAAWLADEVNIEFMEEEGAAFATGNGNKKPRGVFNYDTVADAAWEWGKLGFIASGAAAAIDDMNCLINMTTALKQGFRPNASWLMNRTTEGGLRLLKDGEGRYRWEPSVQVGKPATLLGHPVYTDDNIADVGAGALPVAFGDFRRGYLILDRRGVKILRNPYKNSGFVTFYTTKRVGGGVQHFQAIKVLKVQA